MMLYCQGDIPLIELNHQYRRIKTTPIVIFEFSLFILTKPKTGRIEKWVHAETVVKNYPTAIHYSTSD